LKKQRKQALIIKVGLSEPNSYSTMPAHCGPLGPMECLYGSSCNVTSGVCVDCPAGFQNDEVVFKGNQNCGLDVAGLVVIYVFTTIFSLIVSLVSLDVAVKKKKSRMRSLLLLVTLWTFLVPCLMLSHWLEGYTFGVVSSILMIAIVMLINTQVSMFQYTIDSFMGLLCNYSSQEEIYKRELYWYSFWMSIKVVFGLIIIISNAANSIDQFNIAQVCLLVFMVIEVGANVFRGHRINGKMLKAVEDLHSGLSMDRMNPIIKEFAVRVHNLRYVGPLYGAIFLACAIAIIISFVIYDSSIPYAFVLFDFIVLTWPVLGLIPVLVLRTKLGVHMDNQRTPGSSDQKYETKSFSPFSARRRNTESALTTNLAI